MTELTRTERLSFALTQVPKALRWIVLSGTATFFLTGLIDVVAEVDLPRYATLLVYLVLNTLIYGVAEYIKANGNKS